MKRKQLIFALDLSMSGNAFSQTILVHMCQSLARHLPLLL